MRLGRAAPRLFLTIGVVAMCHSQALACTITTVSVGFGAYDPTAAADDVGVGTINLTCPSNATPTVQLSISAGSGTFAARQMSSGSNVLQYNLYTSSAAGAPVWGDGSAGTVTVSVAGAGATTSTSVYGKIVAKQNVKAGSYADTAIVTVTF
ncbi:MAG: hypothetical protein JWN69_2602 [Alphaproteobacteria bacterium]|nr:hypothetical protein [Alphaproteobacteria bacterium]